MVTTVTQMVKLGSNEAWELMLMFRRNEAWLRKRIRMKPLITLLRSMNSCHREELGDFLCFYPAAYFDGCDALDELLSIVIEQNNQLEMFLRELDARWTVEHPTINLRNAFHWTTSWAIDGRPGRLSRASFGAQRRMMHARLLLASGRSFTLSVIEW